MCSREHGSLPDITHYVAGFPCKPFSLLRGHRTTLLKDPQAKPFYAVIKTLKAKSPRVAVLENVSGILRVLKPIMSNIARMRTYHCLKLRMNPPQLGSPVQRPRVYFLLVRKDAARSGNLRTLQQWAEALWQACQAPSSGLPSLAGICLPANHTQVQQAQAHRRAGKKSKAKAKAKVKTPPKWPARHEAHRVQAKETGRKPIATAAGRPLPSAADLLLKDARDIDHWNINVAFGASSAMGQRADDFAVDLSQNIGRDGARADGTLPTVTPSGNIAVASLGRRLVPVEKLLVRTLLLFSRSHVTLLKWKLI